MSIYSTVVTEIGPNAKEFLAEDMMVLFGDDAPEALRAILLPDRTKCTGAGYSTRTRVGYRRR